MVIEASLTVEEENVSEMANFLKNPDFISSSKTFETYRKDLRIWLRMTTIKDELQAEWIVLNLDGHPSGIKEIIQTQIGDSLEGNAEGIEALITFLAGIYEVDDFQDCIDTYMEFEDLQRNNKESILVFLNRLDQSVARIKKHDCVIPDKVMALKLLKAARLDSS